MVKQLLQAGADPNGTPENPPIVSAAYRGYYRVVEHLLTHPDIEVDKQDIDGLTALWAAAKNGSMGMVNLLLEAGADPSVTTETQGTPAQRAQRKVAEYEAIVQRLEQHTTRQTSSTKP